ncbi:tetratricopeptide repeat protein, partial [bacterium]|nr:tetratricopeptide repeat protein [bacterium]
MKRWAVIIVWAIAGLIFAESVDELLKIGDHFLKRGEYEDALKNYRRAESMDPDNPQVLWRIGAAYNLKAQN